MLDVMVKFLEDFVIFFFALIEADMDIGDVEDMVNLLDGGLEGYF